MPKSLSLRLQDSRAIWRLIGECRELGDERIAWREHLTSGLADLLDADVALSGEMGGCRRLTPQDLGVLFWWRHGLLKPEVIAAYLAEFQVNPSLSPAMLEYHRRNLVEDGSCLTRKDFIADRDWYRSFDYEMIQRPYGVDTTLWCFRQLDGASSDESSGIMLLRQAGRRDFSTRDRTIIREAHRALAPLIGGPLARFADPSPMDLPPRPREVLRCILEGDSDKQVAARLRLSPHTVNEYTKAIYRHFGVKARSELLARWIRRGWGGQARWSRPDAPEPSASESVFSRPA